LELSGQKKMNGKLKPNLPLPLLKLLLHQRLLLLRQRR